MLYSVRTSGKQGKEYPLQEAPADTLVIYCSDHRFQAAVRSFLDEELGLDGNYYSIVFPGSVQILTFGERIPKFTNSLFRPLKFLAKNSGIKRVVIVAHEDCQWYKTFVPLHRTIREAVEQLQTADLLAVQKMLLEYKPDLEVKLYYAHISPGRTVMFTEVPNS